MLSTGICLGIQGQIKDHITGLMLSTPPIVRAQVSEALSVISEHDFPKRWEGLLPQLIERLRNGDVNSVNGVLQTLNSIYKRYRNQFMSSKLNEELVYSQQLIVPLWEVLKKLSTQLQANTADAPAAKQTLSSIRLVCRIFYSLNAPGLTEVCDHSFLRITATTVQLTWLCAALDLSLVCLTWPLDY